MFVDVLGMTVMVATVEEINTAFNLAEQMDREGGLAPDPAILMEINMELDMQFQEEITQ